MNLKLSIVFSKSKKLKSTIKVGEIEIKNKENIKVLGVTFDSNLMWNIHIETVIN